MCECFSSLLIDDLWHILEYRLLVPAAEHAKLVMTRELVVELGRASFREDAKDMLEVVGVEGPISRATLSESQCMAVYSLLR